jgi:hypothetical protein
MISRLLYLAGVVVPSVLAKSTVFVDQTWPQQTVDVLIPQGSPVGYLRRFDIKDSDVLERVLELAEVRQSSSIQNMSHLPHL